MKRLDKSLQEKNNNVVNIPLAQEVRSKMLVYNEAIKHLLPAYKHICTILGAKIQNAAKAGETGVEVNVLIPYLRFEQELIWKQEKDKLAAWVINDLTVKGYRVIQIEAKSDNFLCFFIQWI